MITPQDEKYIETFSKLMIKRIKQVNNDWQQPWFTPMLSRTKNIQGYTYNGINDMLLTMIAQEQKKLPVFMTILQANEQGCHVLKGKTAIPTIFYKPVEYSDNELRKIAEKKGISKDALSKSERIKYMLRRYNNVFNIDDTNLREVKPDLYELLKQEFNPMIPESKEKLTIPSIDKILEDKSWLCPINITMSDRAYFASPRNVEKTKENSYIVVPLKNQFPNQEQFYGTLLHEMAHSTVLDTPRKELDYAHEELVAELSSAFTMARLGVGQPIKDENAKYLKAWAETISENPEVILDITKHASKAIEILETHVRPDLSLMKEKNRKLYEELHETATLKSLGVAEKQIELIKAGKRVFVSNLKTPKGKQFSAYIEKNKTAKSGLSFYQEKPGKAVKNSTNRQSPKGCHLR